MAILKVAFYEGLGKKIEKLKSNVPCKKYVPLSKKKVIKIGSFLRDLGVLPVRNVFEKKTGDVQAC